jgi:hypothetical protein
METTRGRLGGLMMGAGNTAASEMRPYVGQKNRHGRKMKCSMINSGYFSASHFFAPKDSLQTAIAARLPITHGIDFAHCVAAAPSLSDSSIRQ